MNIFQRVAAYANGAQVIKEWLGEGGITVDKELAQKRADICITCPLNVKDWTITDSVASAIRRQIEIKNQLNLRVDGEKSIHSCAACGCATRLKLWIPIRNILPDEAERGNFDSKCWLLSEGKEYEKSKADSH